MAQFLKRALIIDDEANSRELIRHLLSRLGYACEEAENGQLGLHAMRNNPPDLVVLNWKMPVMNGDEVLRVMMTESPLIYIPVIFCTAAAEVEFLEPFKRNLTIEYLRMPFSADKFLGLAQRLISMIPIGKPTKGKTYTIPAKPPRPNRPIRPTLSEFGLVESDLAPLKKPSDRETTGNILLYLGTFPVVSGGIIALNAITTRQPGSRSPMDWNSLLGAVIAFLIGIITMFAGRKLSFYGKARRGQQLPPKISASYGRYQSAEIDWDTGKIMGNYRDQLERYEKALIELRTDLMRINDNDSSGQ